jgi:hypothetical protein
VNKSDPRTTSSWVTCGGGRIWKHGKDPEFAGGENESIGGSSYMEIEISDFQLSTYCINIFEGEAKLSSSWSGRVYK